MGIKKWFGPSVCVLIALILLLQGAGMLPTASSMRIAEPEGRTCADAGGQWGFSRDVGIGCFTPSGQLLAFVHD